MTSKKQCTSLDCFQKTRGIQHDFCSNCWFEVPEILKRRYYFAKHQKPEFLDKALTDIIRSQERKRDATQPNRARNQLETMRQLRKRV